LRHPANNGKASLMELFHTPPWFDALAHGDSVEISRGTLPCWKL